MVDCPVCNGTGKQTVTVIEKDQKSSFEMNCFLCKGTKQVTPAQARAHKKEQEMWCDCENNAPGNVTYVPDNTPRAIIRKHHWVCNSCKKVVQVG